VGIQPDLKLPIWLIFCVRAFPVFRCFLSFIGGMARHSQLSLWNIPLKICPLDLRVLSRIQDRQPEITFGGLAPFTGKLFSYYHRSRTHLALDKDAPMPRPVQGPSEGMIVSIDEVGGLHYRYERLAV
jgi:hypothetical protein